MVLGGAREVQFVSAIGLQFFARAPL